MADTTCSQIVLREMQERLAGNDQKFEEMQGNLMTIQQSVANISQQLVMLHINNGQQRDGYHAPTRFTKMEFPRFTKEDVLGWVSKCEAYFDMDRTAEANKVTMASMALDEMGYVWFDGFKKSNPGPITWIMFTEGIKIKFCNVLRRPLEELMELKQTGKLSDYQERFERIASRSDLSEAQKIGCYLGGLKSEIAWDVRLFSPRSVLEATRLARIKELSLGSTIKGSIMNMGNKRGPSSGAVNTNLGQDQKGILGKPNYKFQSKMTPNELMNIERKDCVFSVMRDLLQAYVCSMSEGSCLLYRSRGT